ncbi:MAG TPA: phosphotransferase [Dehalococcoidia bacterium]|nr:phosphotransferase [Dehalococcoidia bacterium]
MNETTQLHVPGDGTEITADWLTSALHESGDLSPANTVTSVEVGDIGLGRGFAGVTLRVVPTYGAPEEQAPASLIAKLPHFLNLNEELSAMVDLMYSNETLWYRDLSAEIPIRVPKPHWGGMDLENRKFCLLIEELIGLRVFDQRESCSPDEARLIARDCARFHAHWWNSRRLEELPWLLSPARMATELIHPRFKAGWPAFRERYASRLSSEFISAAEPLNERIPELMLAAATNGSTVVHGDYRLENFMFGDLGTDDELVTIDWQLVSTGSGLQDLAYFISQSLTTELRRSLESELLELYYETLRESGVVDYTFEQCQADYRTGLLVSLWIPCNGAGGLGEIEAEGSEGYEDQEQFETFLETAWSLFDMLADRSAQAILDSGARA